MIYLRLREIGGNPDAIQRNRKSIATVFLWATRIEILNESRWFGQQPDISQHRFLELWDQIHLANPAPAAIYLDALLGYLDVDNGWVTESPGSKQGARAASLCLLRALSGVDPISSALEDIRKRYAAVVPPDANFEGLLCYHAINAIHTVLVSRRKGWPFSRMDYNSCAREHVFFANALVQVAHKGKQHGEVPRWVLHSATHSLTHGPQPPVSVTTNCLTIIAIDLGCEIPEDDVGNVDKRYERLAQLHSLSC